MLQKAGWKPIDGLFRNRSFLENLQEKASIRRLADRYGTEIESVKGRNIGKQHSNQQDRQHVGHLKFLSKNQINTNAKDQH